MTARAGAGLVAVVALAVVASCAASPPRAKPAGGAGLAADEEALRAHPPAPERALRFRMPEPYVATLPNGMRLVVLERHALAVVAAELIARGGTASLSHGSPAAVRLMTDTMMAGTKRQNESELYQEMNENLLELSPHAGDGWLGISLRAPASRFDRALMILRDIAVQPTFPAALVDVKRRRLIGDEARFVDEPWVVAKRNLFAALYGLGHPYTVGMAPQAPALQNLGRDDVTHAWRDMLDPAETTLVVAGDVNPVVVRQSVGTLFGDWARDPARRPAVPVPAPEPAAGSSRIVAVDRPGARQATIFYGGRLSDYSAPHSAARVLCDELIEQAEARSKTAATGGEAGATWSAQTHYPTVWWQRTVPPEQAGAALRELEGRIGELRDRGPDANDLKMARARVTRRFLRAFETVEQVAQAYGNLAGLDLSIDWMDKFQASAAEVTWEEIRAALPVREQTRVVVVGNLTALMDPLLSLGWGAVEIHDVEGRLLRTVSGSSP